MNGTTQNDDEEEEGSELPMMIADDIVWAKMPKQPVWPAQVGL